MSAKAYKITHESAAELFGAEVGDVVEVDLLEHGHWHPDVPHGFRENALVAAGWIEPAEKKKAKEA